MWEAIRANRRRSLMVMFGMWLILVALGAGIGFAYDPRIGWAIGVGVAIGVWLIQLAVAWAAGDSLLLRGAGAHKIEKDDAPMLYNVVEEMKIASLLEGFPDIYVIDDARPNAFAVGRDPKKASVAVTSGLLRMLNRDELQGVIAHEIAHIKNRDVRFMTFAGVMLGSIVILSEIALRSVFYGAARRRDDRGGGGGWVMVIVLVMAILAPIFAQMLYFACSRKREYLADASAARFTRFPAGLASALDKISGRASMRTMSGDKPSKVLAPMYIVNPLQGMAAMSLFSTHPPTEKRVAILRKMAGGASYAEYEKAYRETEGGSCIGSRSLQEADEAPIRTPDGPTHSKADRQARAAEGIDLVDRMAQMAVILCSCGMKLKVPPKFKGKEVPCTRCGTWHAIDTAELLTAGAIAQEALRKDRKPFQARSQRRGGSFAKSD